ncbi:MAG: hypothetical protein J6S53_11110 [Lentisphaeria bacterium]|nr:hypothetical protein [Lentisphaeria bacterium]
MGGKLDNAVRKWKNMAVSGQFDTIPKVPSVRECAALFHISHATASKLYTLLANEGWVKKIPSKGIYLNRKYLSGGKKLFFPFLFSKENFQQDSVIRAILQKVLDVCAKNKTVCQWQLTQDEVLSQADKTRDGVLLFIRRTGSSSANSDFAKELLPHFGNRLVLIDEEYTDHTLQCHCFGTDKNTAWDEFVHVFQAQRYKKILIVGSSICPNHWLTLADFLRERYGLAAENICLNASNFTAGSIACSYFKKKSPLLAEFSGQILVIVSSAFFAPGVRKAFEESGISGDIFSCENREFYDYPDKKGYFTSLENNIVRTSGEAAETLCRILQGKEDRRLNIQIPTKLIIRQSVSPPPDKNNG